VLTLDAKKPRVAPEQRLDVPDLWG
jgi:hypothetical protein